MTLLMTAASGACLAAFCFLSFRLFFGSTRALAKPEVDILKASLLDLRAGGILSLRPFDVPGRPGWVGDADLIIERSDRYEAGGELRARELLTRHDGRAFWLSAEPSRAGLVITASWPDEAPRLVDLGLDEAGLSAMDEAQTGQLEWQGERFHLTVCEERSFFKGDGEAGSRFYHWEFEGDERRLYLTIQKWPDEPFSVALGRKLADTTKLCILKLRG